MALRYLLAVLHLLPGHRDAPVYARWGLCATTDTTDLQAVFLADNWYGVAALCWVITGLWRAFGGLEKGSEFYLESHWFIGKMGLFALVFLFELWPMVTLVRWRIDRKRTPLALNQAPLWRGFPGPAPVGADGSDGHRHGPGTVRSTEQDTIWIDCSTVYLGAELH
ncbi:MAG: DUF2214 family protein [Flavobacteriales bacterium]|nr:DUF2214 family protein [Flavobacteriales bacterium]